MHNASTKSSCTRANLSSRSSRTLLVTECSDSNADVDFKAVADLSKLLPAVLMMAVQTQHNGMQLQPTTLTWQTN